MLIQSLLFAVSCVAQTAIEPAHAGNTVFNQVLKSGLDAAGTPVKLPPPRFFDGQTPEAQQSQLVEIAGSKRAADDMLRDSVTAPFIIRVNDSKAPGATVRAVDLWFVIHGDLKQVDPLKEANRADQKDVEVANMWFQTRLLPVTELASAGIKPQSSDAGASDWYVHVHAKLLDRIDFEVTNHVVASQSAESVLIASRTEPSFDKPGPIRNAWKTIERAGSAATPAPARPYSGGASYTKISRAAISPGALIVEMHMAFVEPTEWFDGAPILRSKFSVAAQDQIRALRRELMKRRAH
jgi:hypothetical protein